jgi:hypothetical protein
LSVAHRVENIAKQMSTVRLADALRIIALMVADGDPRDRRTAHRWMRRLEASEGRRHKAAAWEDFQVKRTPEAGRSGWANPWVSEQR